MKPADTGRRQAVTAMESHEDIERLLPVTSWRSWMLALTGLILVAAALLYAGATSKTITVTGTGRAADLYGVRLVTSTVSGQFDDFTVDSGQVVKNGQVIGYVITGNERVPQRAQVDGRVLGLAQRPGDPVSVGDWLTTIAASESDGTQVIATFDDQDGTQVQPQQQVIVTVVAALSEGVGGTGTVVSGVVREVAPGMAARDVRLGLALPEEPAAEQTVAIIALDEHVDPGSIVKAEVVVSERNLLQQVLGRS